MTTDPVCNMTVEEAPEIPTSVYKGQIYHFCCEACKTAFDTDPNAYARSSA
jgi:Cu+-exporting ATPase